MARGEWPRWDARRTVDRVLDLDIRALCRRGLHAGGPVVAWWPGGRFVSALTVELIDGPSVTIAIEYATEDGPVGERVEVERTACNYGGERLWWKCPACGRRCAILYLARERFECRFCGDLAYTTSQSSRWIRSGGSRTSLRRSAWS